MEIERRQRVTEGRGRLRDDARDVPEHVHGQPLQRGVTPDSPQPKQDVGEHGVAGRRRIVVELLLPADELLAVDGREKESAPLIVGEQLHGQ